MNQTEDADAERARLERVAWGSASMPADAARARSALADLDRSDLESVVRTALGHEVLNGDESEVVSDGHETGTADRGTDADDRGRGLLAVVRQRAGRIRRSDHRVLWTLGAVAVVVGFVAGTGVESSVGARTAEPASSVTPAAGAVTIDRRLEQPQTAADLPPAGITTPMERSSARLVFTGRPLSGNDAATPWNVWAGAGAGRDGSTFCLVASTDQLEGTSACYPRQAALHGRVSVATGSEPMYTAGPVG